MAQPGRHGGRQCAADVGACAHSSAVTAGTLPYSAYRAINGAWRCSSPAGEVHVLVSTLVSGMRAVHPFLRVCFLDSLV